jgi:hypothetical protein
MEEYGQRNWDVGSTPTLVSNKYYKNT